MRNEELDEIIKAFSYSQKLRGYWDFLDDYSKKVEEWLLVNSFEHKQVVRYMLVGLFLHYRGCVHRSNTLTTDVEKYIENNLGIKDKDRKLFLLFNRINEKPIQETQDYVRLIGLEKLDNITGQSLFDFVITGTPIG